MACKKCEPYLRKYSGFKFSDLKVVFDTTILHESSPVCEQEPYIMKGEGICGQISNNWFTTY